MKLKPLEWRETYIGQHYVADTPFGPLSVTKHLDDRYFITFRNSSSTWLLGDLEDVLEVAEEMYQETVMDLFENG